MNDQSERSRIAAVVSRHGAGIPLGELLAAMREGGAPISESTLIRRLRVMVANGTLRAEGRAPARRYFANPSNETTDVVSAADQRDTNISLSSDAEALRTQIRLPITRRQPVGYHEDFIRTYEPGVSWYLDQDTRDRLQQLGTTTDTTRPAGTFARNILERLLIDLSWASSRLEGNTYSRLDTRNLLEHGLAATGKAAVETQMILNHKRAIEMLVGQAENIGFNRHTMLNVHAALSENLLTDRRDEGRLRQRLVGITGTTFIPLSIPQKIDELFDLMLRITQSITDPFEQSFFLMVHLPYLQPFVDVNKRTSRLAANIPFITANLCPLSFVDLPEQLYVDATIAVYELNRIELLRDAFAWAYERSARQYHIVRDSLPSPDPIRLRYRHQIEAIVRDTVMGQHTSTSAAVREWAATHRIPPDEQDAFVDAVSAAIMDLHEGNIQRFGLRLSEYVAWKNQEEIESR